MAYKVIFYKCRVISSFFCMCYSLQYRHLIPAQVDRTSASAWMYKHPWNMSKQKNSPSTSMTHVTYTSKLCSVSFEVTSPSMPWDDWLAIGHAVECYARVAHAFSAGIKRLSWPLLSRMTYQLIVNLTLTWRQIRTCLYFLLYVHTKFHPNI